MTAADARVLLAFRKRPANEIASIMLQLTEKVIDEDVARAKAGSPDWWLAWARVANKARPHGIMSVEP